MKYYYSVTLTVVMDTRNHRVFAITTSKPTITVVQKYVLIF